MRFIELNTARTIDVELEQRADATPTFLVRAPAGGISLVSGPVVMSVANTTLSGAAAKGAVTATVADATGITRGSKYQLTGAEAVGGEFVTVKSVNGTTIMFVRPLEIAHASGASFQSTKLSCAITAAAVGYIGRGYRIEVTYAVGAVTQPVAVYPFMVVRTAPITYLRADDVADLDPIFAKRKAAGVWFPALAEKAWEMMMIRVGVKLDPGAVLLSRDMTIPHSYLVRALALEGAGEANAAMLKDMRERFQQEFDGALACGPVDDNQDGSVASNEGWRPHSISLMRG